MFYHTIGHDPVATTSASQASRDARNASTRTKIMEADIERLLMITEALWTLLKEEHGYSDDVLRDRVMQIDLRDGKLDGKVAPTPATNCPTCSRTLNKKRLRCIYCGHEVEPDLFER